MARRDQNDEEWRALRLRVRARDRGCRLCRILNTQDFITLRKNAGVDIHKLDPAHIFAVSTHPELCYNDDNVVMLNRYSHDNLDNCRNPITGENIDRDERDEWWEKIAKDQYHNVIQLTIT